MYRDHPDDLRPSRLARWLAHGGTAVEYGFPVLLVLGSGGWLTTVGLAVMLAFHLYITVNVPLGVPIEWNVFFVYSAFVLFGVHAEIDLLSIDAPLLGVLLVTALLVVPAVGNLMPARVSFLPSMRYYAGNWATSLWLFRHGSLDRLDEGLIKSAPLLRDQLRRFYTEPVVDVVLGRTQAFRAMHLHGRALNLLVRRAVDDPDAYDVYDGELIAGLALGWNFGDGHLHHEQLLAAIQAQCGFEEGELRCVLVESQPLGGPGHRWRIVDAAAGQLEAGEIAATELLAAQPWGAAVTDRPPARGA